MPAALLANLRIFISHSNRDDELGIRLSRDLQRLLGDDSAVWYDGHGGLHGGDDWWSTIVEKIEECNVFIVLLSPDAVESRWVMREINLAWMHLNEQRRLMPLLYRSCNVRSDLKMLQIIDFLPPRPYKDAFKDLQITLEKFAQRLPRQAVKAPSSSRPPVAPQKSIQQQPATSTTAQVKPAPTKQNTSASISAVKKTNSAVRTQQLLLQEVDEAFLHEDWARVDQKANLVAKQFPAAAAYKLYRMQAIALHTLSRWNEAYLVFEQACKAANKEQQLEILQDFKQLCAQRGQWEKVRAYAIEALKLVPQDPEWQKARKDASFKLSIGRLDQGDKHYEASRYTEAIQAYDEAIALHTENANAYFKRAAAWLKLNETTNVIRDCSAAIKLHPQHVHAHIVRGIGYFKRNDLPKAIKDWDEAINCSPRNADAYHLRGLAYSKHEEYAPAIENFANAMQLAPERLVLYHHRAEAHRLFKDYARAMYFCNEAIQRDKQQAESYHLRGRLYVDYEQPISALQDLNYALSQDPNQAISYYYRGEAYRKVNKYDMAIRDMYCARELNYEAAYAYWSENAAQDDGRSAFAEYKRMIDNRQVYAQTCEAAAAIYIYYKRYDKAVECLDYALSSATASPLGYWLRANAYLALEQFSLAVNDCNLSLALEQQNAIAYRIRGEAYLGQKKYQEAIEDCSRAIDLSSESIDLTYGTILLGSSYASAYKARGQAYYESGQNERAMQDLSRAIKLRSKYSQAYYQRGYVLCKQKNPQQAIYDFTRAIEYQEDSKEAAKAYNARGECYRILNEQQHAHEDFRKALELDPQLSIALENTRKAYT